MALNCLFAHKKKNIKLIELPSQLQKVNWIGDYYLTVSNEFNGFMIIQYSFMKHKEKKIASIF